MRCFNMRAASRDASILLVVLYFLAAAYRLVAHMPSHAQVAYAATGINIAAAGALLGAIALVELLCCAALVFSDAFNWLGLVAPTAVLAAASLCETALYGELTDLSSIVRTAFLCSSLFTNSLSLFIEQRSLQYHGVPLCDLPTSLSGALRRVATRARLARWLAPLAVVVLLHAAVCSSFWTHHGAMREIMLARFFSELSMSAFFLAVAAYDHPGSRWSVKWL